MSSGTTNHSRATRGLDRQLLRQLAGAPSLCTLSTLQNWVGMYIGDQQKAAHPLSQPGQPLQRLSHLCKAITLQNCLCFDFLVIVRYYCNSNNPSEILPPTLQPVH